MASNPEPEINELAVENAPELARITILSNSGDAMPHAQVVEIKPSSGGPKGPQTKRKRRRKDGPAFLQQEELERLFKAIDSVRDRAIFRVMYHAGLRASEISQLDMRDYQPRTERLYIRRLKGSHAGEHHLVREEARALRAWLKQRGSAPGPIFPSNRGRGISRNMLDVLFKRYAAAAGIPRALRHVHVLKHSCATHLLERGFGVEQVQDWLGHANIQNTMIYARISNRRRDEMAAQLKDAWR
jgi:integrase/recombinase XerD